MYGAIPPLHNKFSCYTKLSTEIERGIESEVNSNIKNLCRGKMN
jgi:hypothetical protein